MSFILLGILSVLPWNTLLISETFLIKRLEDASLSSTFANTVNVSAVTSALVSSLYIYFNGFNPTTRKLYFALVLKIASVAVIIGLLQCETWTNWIVYSMYLIVFILQSASTVFQFSAYGLLTFHSIEQYADYIRGGAVGGIITSIIPVTTQFQCTSLYVSLMVFMLLSVYNVATKKQPHGCCSNDEEESSKWIIFKRINVHLFSIFVTFLITLLAFPAIMTNVDGINISLECFLLYNLFSYLGSSLSKKFVIDEKYLIYLSIMRVMFIPLFLFCNYHPVGVERKLIVVFGNWAYDLIAILFSMTHGYISTLLFFYSPRHLNDIDRKNGATITTAVTFIGIMFGLCLSYLLPYFLN